MKFGIWFFMSPTAVVSTYFTHDPIAVTIEDSDFDEVDKWDGFIKYIDFCVITALNSQNLPGNNEKILKLVKKMKNNGIRVYLAVSCLLGMPGGTNNKHLVDLNMNESRTWKCPCDEKRKYRD